MLRYWSRASCPFLNLPSARQWPVCTRCCPGRPPGRGAVLRGERRSDRACSRPALRASRATSSRPMWRASARDTEAASALLPRGDQGGSPQPGAPGARLRGLPRQRLHAEAFRAAERLSARDPLEQPRPVRPRGPLPEGQADTPTPARRLSQGRAAAARPTSRRPCSPPGPMPAPRTASRRSPDRRPAQERARLQPVPRIPCRPDRRVVGNSAEAEKRFKAAYEGERNTLQVVDAYAPLPGQARPQGRGADDLQGLRRRRCRAIPSCAPPWRRSKAGQAAPAARHQRPGRRRRAALRPRRRRQHARATS